MAAGPLVRWGPGPITPSCQPLRRNRLIAVHQVLLTNSRGRRTSMRSHGDPGRPLGDSISQDSLCFSSLLQKVIRSWLWVFVFKNRLLSYAGPAKTTTALLSYLLDIRLRGHVHDQYDTASEFPLVSTAINKAFLVDRLSTMLVSKRIP